MCDINVRNTKNISCNHISIVLIVLAWIVLFRTGRMDMLLFNQMLLAVLWCMNDEWFSCRHHSCDVTAGNDASFNCYVMYAGLFECLCEVAARLTFLRRTIFQAPRCSNLTVPLKLENGKTTLIGVKVVKIYVMSNERQWNI